MRVVGTEPTGQTLIKPSWAKIKVFIEPGHNWTVVLRFLSLSLSLAYLIEFLFDVLSVAVFVISDRFAKKPTRA